MKMKKKDNKGTKVELSDTKRIVLFTCVIVFVVILIGVLSFFILSEKKESETPQNAKTNSTEIVGYGITADDLDSELYKAEFAKLKSNLESKDIDYREYASSVAKMFVIDLYTIKTKINKYDIGGVEFVLPERKDNFITNVSDTIYNYVEDNSNGKRNQSLPVVNGVEITSTKEATFKVDALSQTYPAYVFEINISYSSDLGYDTKAEVTVINKDNFMYVVEKN